MQREHMWSAYLDGELSASEAAEFDQSLTPHEKELLQSEVRFEGAMGEFLGRGGACPRDVWQRTVAALPKPAGGMPWWMPTWQATVFLVAAALMVTLAGPLYRTYTATPEFLAVNETSRSAGVARLGIASDNVSEVNEYLHSHGITLTLSTGPQLGNGRHVAKLMGASEELYKDERVTEVLYQCCGKPIKVVIAPKDGMAAKAVRKAIERNEIQDFRTIGGYVAVTVSRHPSSGLLDLLSEDHKTTEIALREV
jgi:anti-sigma factor RsiW